MSFLLLASTLFVCITVKHLIFSGKRAPTPPGPVGLPLLGNVLQVPYDKPWFYFTKLSQTYGSIVRLRLGLDEVVVLNDAKVAEELLSGRSKNYSSRRSPIYAGKYVALNSIMVFSNCGDGWKKLRTAYHAMFNNRAMNRYVTLNELESTRMILDLQEKRVHGDLTQNMIHYAGSVIHTIVYGRRPDEGSTVLDEMREIMDSLVKDAYPGAHLVDTFPFLDYLPDFLSPWRSEAIRKRELEIKFYGALAERVRRERDEHTAVECFTTYVLDKEPDFDFDEFAMLKVTGEMFQAGSDTIASTLLWFFAAMLLYPNVLEKAQSEIDSIVGSDGSSPPFLHHLNELPYCFAVIKETFRWNPVVPGCFPHTTDVDDTFNGYIISAGTLVIPNIWAMHRNETRFKNSSEFRPERFLHHAPLSLSELSEDHFSFGFGRRICPGRNLALQSLWIAITRIIWACNIEYAKDSQGNRIHVDPSKTTTQILSRPLPFPAVITPRSQAHEISLRNAWKAAQDAPPPDFGAITEFTSHD